MKDYDLIIKNGTIANECQVYNGSIGVIKGKIEAIFNSKELPNAKEIIDATGKIVMPGCIDSHVHFYEPGQTWREDFEQGTKAAAAGGVTTVLEHPVSIPPVKDKETFELKLGLAKEKSYIDFGLWGALIPNNVHDIKNLLDLGCVAVKGFISYATEEYPNISDSGLFEALTLLKKTGGLIAVHAENAEMADTGAKKLQKIGRKDPIAHLESRESHVELEAISRAVLFAKITGGRIHIVHMSINEGAELIKRAKEEGVPVTVETCPHFLMADSRLLEEKGPFAKCTPPLRRQENTKKMWKYVEDGTIDFITSDHAPYSYEEKAKAIKNIWLAENGIPGVGTLVPLMIEGCLNKRKIPLTRFVEIMSTNVAKVFHLYPKKGSISIGADADFTIINQHKKWVFNAKKKYYKCGWSPFDGREIEGDISHTIVRGNIVYKEGEILGKKGYGEFLNPNKINK